MNDMQQDQSTVQPDAVSEDRTQNQATTHFGFKTVAEDIKAKAVGQVFDSVAGRYDLMNDLMSAGLHRLWKRFAVMLSGVKPGDQVLDVAGGSGDMTRLLQAKVGHTGMVVHTDINASMLAVGRDRLIEAGVIVPSAQCDAEQLPFPDQYFDCVVVAFGLRNMTHKERALAEMQRVLKMGGCLQVLEFSKIHAPLQPAYDLYSFKLLPFLGKLVAKDAESYQYLAESIRMHPDQQTLRDMMLTAGFARVQYHNLSAGVVALHQGWK